MLRPPPHVFDPLPLKEQLFIRALLFSAPLAAVASRVAGAKVADIGCGHGVLSALLLVDHPDRRIVGVDPDPRKIAWARASVGRLPNTHFLVGTAEDLARAEPGSFDAVVVTDVLYLLPVDAWAGFLRTCRTLLAPGGRLLLKEAEDDGSWRAKKTLLQERLMVSLLERTRASGAIGFSSRERIGAALREAGCGVREIVPLGKGYTTPHVLFIAQAV